MSSKPKRLSEARRTSAALDNFAIRCFRDVADHDYIVARLAFRHGLYAQFHWAALQALEKYLKGILLLNRIPSRSVGHELGNALELAAALPFEIHRSSETQEFIERLDRFGPYRYLESSYYVLGAELAQLDRAVWEIRRYCQRLNYFVGSGPDQECLLALNVRRIEGDDPLEWRRIDLPGGKLESIIVSRSNPARAPLVWKNRFFASRRRRSVKMPAPFHVTNAPLSLRPELVEAVLEYVRLGEVPRKEYRKEVARRAKEAKKQ